MKKVLIHLDDKDHKKLIKEKGFLTWAEFLIQAKRSGKNE